MESGPIDEAVAVADFDAVIEQYRPRIFRFALAALRDRDAAQTVTPDCPLKAYRAWDQFRGEASVQTWLMRARRGNRRLLLCYAI